MKIRDSRKYDKLELDKNQRMTKKEEQNNNNNNNEQ